MKEIKSPRIKILEPNDKIIRVHAILHALSIGTIEIYNSFVSSNSLFIGWMMNGILQEEREPDSEETVPDNTTTKKTEKQPPTQEHKPEKKRQKRILRKI